jgi:hypothetical protein
MYILEKSVYFHKYLYALNYKMYLLVLIIYLFQLLDLVGFNYSNYI